MRKKKFWLENRTSKPQNGLGFNIYHDIEPNLESKKKLYEKLPPDS